MSNDKPTPTLKDQIKEKLLKASVRAILAFVFGATTCYAFLKGSLSDQDFVKVLMIIIMFYFTTKESSD